VDFFELPDEKRCLVKIVVHPSSIYNAFFCPHFVIFEIVFQPMTVVINKKSTGKQVEKARKKVLKGKTPKQGVASAFGALKRGLDGLKYQKAVRNEWD